VSDRLAVDGGRPVRDTLLPYGHQTVDESDVQRVLEVLRSAWLTTGPAVGGFEQAFAAAVGAEHAVAVSSGTAALHAAAFAAGIGPGDEVITTPMTFVATANCILYLGADVVFADVQPESLNLDPARVAEAITDRTRAIVAVDYAGQPADLDDLRTIATEHGIAFLEDAAHALGARYRGRTVGSIANLTTFSFHPVKHITSGEGGMITTDDAELADRARLFCNHGISADFRQREQEGSWYYEMVELGHNLRLTDIQAALGTSQLEKAGRWVERRREIAKMYDQSFEGLACVRTPVIRPEREPAWHLYVLRFKPGALEVGRQEVFRALRAENIGVNVHYIPVPWHPYYRHLGFRKGGWPVAEAAYEELISLPIWPGMTDGDVQDVVDAIQKVACEYAQTDA